MQKVLKYFLVWRLFLFVAAAFAGYFITLRTGYLYNNYWANLDGVHYISIAQNGYGSQAVFFPLYPLLIRFFSFGRWYFPSAIIISNVCILLSLYFLQKLLMMDYKRERAWEIVLILILFPTSFFFGAVYSESLFLLLLILCFYFARKNMWFMSVVCAAMLTATRIVGIFILPALMYEYYIQKNRLNFGLLAASVSLFAYSVFNHIKWGDFLYFVHAHGELANGRSVSSIIMFPQTIFRYVKILASLSPLIYEWWVALLELWVFFFAFYLLFVAWKKKVRTSYLIFSALAFLFHVSSGTFSGLPRYVLILFPIFIAISFLGDKIKKMWLVISTSLLTLLVMLFVRGYFVA